MFFLKIENPVFYTCFNAFLLVLSLFFLFKLTQRLFYRIFNKSLYVHFYPLRKKMPSASRAYLQTSFKFYSNLSPERKLYFEHRVMSFVAKKEFIGRDNLKLTNEMQLLIAATAVMLTFGMKSYFCLLYTSPSPRDS